jgi:hypothetical protein
MDVFPASTQMIQGYVNEHLEVNGVMDLFVRVCALSCSLRKCLFSHHHIRS